jgi:hypothetical protein
MTAIQFTKGEPDLRWATDFVHDRIRQSAQAISETLTEEDEEKLENLPSDFVDPYFSPEFGAGGPIPPDRSYDKLVRIAKVAVKQDRDDNGGGSMEWELADAILRVHKHRLSWLIERAGVSVKIKKPWWDGWLLVICGIAVTSLTLATAALANELGFSSDGQIFGSICAVFVPICVILFYVLGGFERRLRLNRIRELKDQVR